MRACSLPPTPFSSARRQSGIALVEFTIVVPLLLLMLLGFTELGRAMMQYTELTKHTRDAARYLASSASYGSTGTIKLDEVAEAAQNLVVYGNRTGSGDPLLPGLTLEDVTVSNAGSGYIRVQASYSYQPMIGSVLPGFGFGSDIDLNFTLVSSSDMRVL